MPSTRVAEEVAERATQLLRGIRGAAAASPPEHTVLAERATGAAERLAATAERHGEAAVRALEELHYRLVKCVVQSLDPAELDLEGAIRHVEELGAASAGSAEPSGG